MSDGQTIADIHNLTLERSIYIGNAFSLILYGLNLFMCGQSVYFLMNSQGTNYRQRMFYVGFGLALTVLITIAVGANAMYGQMMYVEHRDVPGGPVAFFATHSTDWYNTLGSAADITANFLGDALLVYRCYIIWDSKWWVALVPALMFCTSTALAIMTVVSSALPNASIFTGPAKGFGVPWVALTVSLNVLVTLIISSRLLIARHKVRAALTPGISDVYTGVVAVLVESAAPFTILGIGFLIAFAKELDVEIAFAFIWGTLCAVSPQLIIMRVSMGKAWSKSTVSQFAGHNSTMVFHRPSQSQQQRSIGLETFSSAKNASTTADSGRTAYDKYNSESDLTTVA
jgi:hypothetical protein